MKILCYGDSNTYGYDPRSFFGEQYDPCWVELLAERANCSVINLGENGRQIPNTPVSFSADTDLLIVMLGTNDLLQSLSAEAAARKMEHFLSNLPAERENLLLIAPPPFVLGAWVPDQTFIAASKALANHYQALAERLGIRFLDAGKWNIPIAFDGVHFTQDGHRIFADELYLALVRGGIIGAAPAAGNP